MSIADKLTTIATNAQKVNESNERLSYVIDGVNLGRTLQGSVNQLESDKRSLESAFGKYDIAVATDTPLGVFPEYIDEVYYAGVKSEYDKFWDGVQDNGNRTNYARAFQYWGAEYISPKYVVVPTSNNSNYLFNSCSKLKGIDANKFDYSGVPVNYSAGTGGPVYALFNKCTSLVSIPDIKIPATVGYGYFCYDCQSLVTIEAWRVSKESQFDGSFYNCIALENITVVGEIGQNKLSFADSKNLTHESLMSIINALYNYKAEGSTATHTLTLGTTNLNKLTEAEQQLARDKGWSLV